MTATSVPNVTTETLDACPLCGRIGLWWIDGANRRYHCIGCYRDGRCPGPDAALVAVYREAAGLWDDEQLHGAISDYEYLIELAGVDDRYPDEVNAQSHLNALAAIVGYRAELAWRESIGISKPESRTGWDRDFLDRLKAAVRIEAEIGRAIPLRRQGKALTGLCPFHEDRNPSLVVWPEDGRWRCFGCGIHGDILSWLQAYNRLSFREAVESLASQSGIAMPTKSRRRVVQIGGR